MLLSTVEIHPGRHRRDPFYRSLDRLRRSLAVRAPGHETEWARHVGQALVRVEHELRQHLAVAHSPDGLLGEVHDIRPTLTRKAWQLCRLQCDLVERCLALQEETRCAADACSPLGDAFEKAIFLQGRAGCVPDFGEFREQVEEFLVELQQFKEAENHLILDSVNTDIGVGD